MSTSTRLLTFEVFADEGDFSVGAILGDASAGLIASEEPRSVVGYAAYGQSIKAAVAPLVDCYDVELFDDGELFISVPGLSLAIADDELGNSADAQTAPKLQREQDAVRSLPSALRLGYYDPALDYQAGEARASSAERRGREAQQELTAAVSASEAKSLAQRIMAREWARRDKLTVRLPPRYLDLRPGARLDLDLAPARWRVEQSTIDGFVAVIELRPDWNATASLPADSGRIVANQDDVAADVTLALFDLPDVLETGLTSPSVLLAASSPSGGWKPCSVEIRVGQQSLRVQSARRKSVLGRALGVLPSGNAFLINRDDVIDVELIDREQWLMSCDDEALVCGANLAVLGSELIQFGTVEPLGDGRFRLSRLVRGRAGTEWAMDSHSIGEPFVLIEHDALSCVALPSSAIGATVSASVVNLSGRITPAEASVTSEALRPPSPVRLSGSADAAGALTLSWTRRSRRGFIWVDEIDAPLGETSERYRVNVTGTSTACEFEASEPSLHVASDEVAALGAGTATVEVRQIGDAAASRPATFTLTI